MTLTTLHTPIDTAHRATIDAIRRHVATTFSHECSGHDWEHIRRVWALSKTIAAAENQHRSINLFVVEAAALLHDIADWKFHQGDEHAGARVARDILTAQSVAEPALQHICRIINEVSFKGAGVATPVHSLESAIVQDADRLDAMGAIGIARVFAYGGSHDIPMHDPHLPPTLHMDSAAYRSGSTTSINHFHEKLLLLKDRMNTATGKQIAADRHLFLEHYLQRFALECGGQA